MKALKYILPLVIVVLAYLLYRSISDPIEFQKKKARVEAKVIQRLKDIRKAEVAYRSVNGVYTASLDTLVSFVRNGRLPIITKIGDPEDSASVVRVDTTYVPVLDSLFGPGYAIDSLPFVPFSGGVKFDLQASTIQKGGVTLPVFQAVDPKPIDPKRPLQVGSLTEASNAGNWE